MLLFGITGQRYVSTFSNDTFNILTDFFQAHSASYGFTPHRRHAVRVATHAERPVLEATGKSQEEELNALYGLPAVNKDGSRQSNYND